MPPAAFVHRVDTPEHASPVPSMPWSGLFAVINADSDDRVSNERAVTAVLVQQFQTAHYHRHVGVAVREGGSNLSDIHLVRAWRSDGHLDRHIVSGGANQPGESETAVVNSIKDGALGRQRVIEAVDIHAHPHLCNEAHQRHGIPPALAIVLGATTSCVDTPSHTLRSFNGSRNAKSSGVAAHGVTAVAQ